MKFNIPMAWGTYLGPSGLPSSLPAFVSFVVYKNRWLIKDKSKKAGLFFHY